MLLHQLQPQWLKGTLLPASPSTCQSQPSMLETGDAPSGDSLDPNSVLGAPPHLGGGRVSSPAAAGLCEEQSPPVGHLPMEAASKICSGTCCCPDRPLWWEHHSSVQEGTMAQQTSLFLPSFQSPCWPLHLMTSVVRSTEQRDVLTHTQEPP